MAVAMTRSSFSIRHRAWSKRNEHTSRSPNGGRFLLGNDSNARFKELRHLRQNFLAGLRLVNSLAQRRAAWHAIREEGCELLHFADAALKVFFDQHREIRAHHVVAVYFRGNVILSCRRVLR